MSTPDPGALSMVAPVKTGELNSTFAPYAPTGPDYLFPDVDVMVDALQHIKQTALPEGVA